MIVAAALAVAFALLPRRRLRMLPLILLVAFAAASVSASRFVADQARAQQRIFVVVRRPGTSPSHPA